MNHRKRALQFEFNSLYLNEDDINKKTILNTANKENHVDNEYEDINSATIIDGEEFYDDIDEEISEKSDEEEEKNVEEYIENLMYENDETRQSFENSSDMPNYELAEIQETNVDANQNKNLNKFKKNNDQCDEDVISQAFEIEDAKIDKNKNKYKKHKNEIKF